MLHTVEVIGVLAFYMSAIIGTTRDERRRRTMIAFTVDVNSRQVSILGVFHGGQDYEAAFGGLEDEDRL